MLQDIFLILMIPMKILSIDIYQRKPIELSAYLQDKIELNEIIINVGFRLDYFDSDGHGIK